MSISVPLKFNCKSNCESKRSSKSILTNQESVGQELCSAWKSNLTFERKIEKNFVFCKTFLRSTITALIFIYFTGSLKMN